jgi:MFS family permease
VFFGFGSLFISTFGIFLKPVSQTLSWSRSEISSGFTVAVLCVALMSPWLGRVLDRVPARRIVLPCLAIYGLGFASLSLLTRHLWHLVAVYAVMGVAGIPTTQLGYARVVSAWFDEARGRALAAVMAGSGIGFMVFPPVAQFLISSYGWRTAYAVLGAAALLVSGPLVWFFLYEPAAEQQERDVFQEKHGREKHRPARSYAFWGIAGALLLFSFATNGLNTHWAALLTDRGLTAASAAAVLSIAGGATLASKLFTGYLLDRFRANRVAAILLFCTAIGMMFILAGKSLPVAYASALLVGAGMGAESDAVPYLLTRYFGLDRFSELYGYTWTVYAVAGALGPLLAGAVFDHTGSYRAALFLFLGLAVAAAGLFASLPCYATPEPISVDLEARGLLRR